MLNWFLCEREISSLNKTFQRQRLNCYTLTDIFATVCLNEHTLTVCCMQRICPKCLPWSWVMHTGSSVSVSMGHSLGHGSVFPLVTHWVIGQCFPGSLTGSSVSVSLGHSLGHSWVSVSLGHSLGHRSVFSWVTHWVMGQCFPWSLTGSSVTIQHDPMPIAFFCALAVLLVMR